MGRCFHSGTLYHAQRRNFRDGDLLAEGASDLKIPPDRRDGCAVYAVAIGDHLGLKLEDLMRLRRAAESSTLIGEHELDEILRFVENLDDPPSDAKLRGAYAAVAPVIQPLGW